MEAGGLDFSMMICRNRGGNFWTGNIVAQQQGKGARLDCCKECRSYRCDRKVIRSDKGARVRLFGPSTSLFLTCAPLDPK